MLVSKTTGSQAEPDINLSSYKLPDILMDSGTPKMIEVVSCAFRKYMPEKGQTGGPSGVLAMQQEAFGDSFHGMRMQYLFHPQNVKYPLHLEEALSGLDRMLKTCFHAAYYLEHCTSIWQFYTNKTGVFFICHDVGSAYGAYLRNCKYVLIYHHQGALVYEREAFAAVLSERDKELINKLEETVFTHAEAVYFPSDGAKKSFIDTTTIDYTKVKFGSYPLYNTIRDVPDNLDDKSLLGELGIEIPDLENTDIFLSVGDFNANKGMDRIPIILNKLAQKSKRKLFWIAVGARTNTGIYEKLLEVQSTWNFESKLFGTRVDHNTLLALMNLADYYIMLHRYSVFDLATLEAMRAGKALILSNVGGNLDVNKEDNVILVDMNQIDSAVIELSHADKMSLGQKNREVFQRYFSKEQFFKAYSKMIDYHVGRMGISINNIDEGKMIK